MSHETLFVAAPSTPEAHLPDAEIYVSPISRYVLDEMPADLEAVRAGVPYEALHVTHAVLLEQVREDITNNTDPGVAEITQLDLAFMLGGYLPAGDKAFAVAPPQLRELMDMQAEKFGLPRLMTYDLIVNVNSAEYQRTGRMRTYTAGDTGRHERDFYLGHYQAEPYVSSAAQAVRQVVSSPDSPATSELLIDAAQNMRTFRDYMAAYLRFAPNDFATIRPYLATYPDNTRNASGAFMPSTQLLELALYPPSEGQLTYLRESEAYFPQSSRGVIQQALELSQQGQNVADRFAAHELSLNPDGETALTSIIDEFVRFRMTHLAVTRQQIPGAFPAGSPRSRDSIRKFGEPDILGTSTPPGTAGFDAERVLVGAISRLLTAAEQFQPKRQGVEA